MVALRWPDGGGLPLLPGQGAVFPQHPPYLEVQGSELPRQFSIKVGTIFEDSPLGLEKKWLPALWMIANDKNGISSYELHRALGVTQKTAWFHAAPHPGGDAD